MINKKILVDIIEKYYLNGLTESVKFSISNKTLNIPFTTTNKDVVGAITTTIDLADAEFGIFETSPFLKLLNILDKDIQIEYQETQKIIEKLLIEDNQYKLSFSLADTYLIPSAPKAIDVPYQLVYQMESDFITRFVECKKALGSDIRTFVLDTHADGKTEFILGDPSGYANKIEFSINAQLDGFPFSPMIFPSDVMKEILIANKHFDSATLKVNEGGLINMCFEENGISSSYYIMASQN